MMYGWHDQGAGPGWWIVMLIGMVLFWSLFAFAIVATVRHFSRHRNEAPWMRQSPVEILKTRFANGEIDEAEFKARLALLEGTK